MSDQNTDFSVSDVEYNLITTLSNLLQSEEVLARYVDDANEAGESDVAQIFQELRDHNSATAVRMRESLHRLLAKG